MKQRARKLVGTIVLVVFVSVYALAAMAIGAAILPGKPSWAQFLYYAIAGLIWVIPAAALVYWMQKPDRSDT